MHVTRAEHWQLKAEVSWVRLPAAAGLFTFLMGSFLMERIIRLTPNRVLTAHTELAARCATEAFSTTCTVHTEDYEGWRLAGCRGTMEGSLTDENVLASNRQRVASLSQ